MSTRTRLLLACVLTASLAGSPEGVVAAGPGLANGARVGEVGERSALVWTRLTRESRRLEGGRTQRDSAAAWQAIDDSGTVPLDADEGRAAASLARPASERARLELPPGWRVEQLDGACPPARGSVRVVWRADGSPPGSEHATEWVAVDERTDGAVTIPLHGLEPGARHVYRVETRAETGEGGATFEGSFRTAQPPDGTRRVAFTVVTGMMIRDLDHADGFEIYRSMSKARPDFLVVTGDTVYYDSEWPRARSSGIARYHWNRTYSLPRIVELHGSVPGYWIKDDHDVYDNDCWPGRTSAKLLPFTFEEGQRIFREQNPVPERLWRSVRRGRHLELWIVEGRDHRSPNRAADGPEKTIWGREQLDWLRRSLIASDATFKVLVSATPIVGPDRGNKGDNHANQAFAHEGELFRDWSRESLPDRFFVVCGDRHWQYHSVDPESRLVELSCGPASDQHAGGSPGPDPAYHRFHRVGGGFLSVEVSEEPGRPTIAFRLHAVDGSVVHEHVEADLRGVELASVERDERVISDRLVARAQELLDARAATVDALTDPEAIRARQQRIRATVLESLGGLPEATPLRPRITGRLEADDHVVEKILFESRPGFVVSAHLYLPRSPSPPWPAVLFPCGHAGEGKAGPLYQAAGQEFARRGFATLIYDPIGQGERFQFLDESGRPRVGGTTEHTLTGTAALLVGASVAQVIVHDGVRAIDYLASRDDIDLSRLACTGNSGGGTQTSYLMVVDPRIRAAAPSCYLTTFSRLFATIGPQDAEQNLPGFVAAGLDHADLVHAFAPKPALICAASEDFFAIDGTWTTFREAKRIYGRLGAPEAVDLVEVDAGHGYHPEIRQRVGRFLEASLLGRSADEITPRVPFGVARPQEELWVTEGGQVARLPGVRTVADLWREREAGLRDERERRFASMPREEWLAGARRLAAMLDEAPHPEIEWVAKGEVAGVRFALARWMTRGLPVVALTVGPRGAEPSGVEVLVSDRGLERELSRLVGRARAGELLVAVDLPGYGRTAPRAVRSGWGDDWQHAFLSFHLDTPLAGLRADALRAAVSLARAEGGDTSVRVSAHGRACVPALLAAAVDARIDALRLEDGLESWASIVADGLHSDRLGNIVPGALAWMDLPLLRRAIAPRRVEAVRPRGPHGERLDETAAQGAIDGTR